MILNAFGVLKFKRMTEQLLEARTQGGYPGPPTPASAGHAAALCYRRVAAWVSLSSRVSPRGKTTTWEPNLTPLAPRFRPQDSGLPYTLLRPGRLTDGPYTSYDLNTLLKATSGTKRAVQARGCAAADWPAAVAAAALCPGGGGAAGCLLLAPCWVVVCDCVPGRRRGGGRSRAGRQSSPDGKPQSTECDVLRALV